MPVAARIRGSLSGAVAALAVGLSGCGKPPPYPPDLVFPARDDRLVIRVPTVAPAGYGDPGRLDAELAALDALGGKTADPAAAPAAHRAALDAYLAAFGTPAAPTLAGDGPLPPGLIPERLAEGGRLYRRHCLQCHGLGGDGRGPTSLGIYPHARDFRRGAFKFVSTGDGGKPRAADLARTIRDGLPGSAMPAFALLPEDQREAMAAFVVYLSVRGQVEFQTLAATLTEGDGGPSVEGEPAEFARQRRGVILRDWERAAAAPPAPAAPPPADEAAVRRGYELFTTKGAADCATCHEDFGRMATYRYDVWGTVVRPADLTAPARKGGDRPEEVFHRIRGGIQPAGMPAHPALTDTQVWDVAHFVRALPFPRDLPPDVRAKVYP